MRISSFQWDTHNLDHALRHGVSREEIEEVLTEARLVRRGRSGVYVGYGQTLDGRYVLVVFDYRGREEARPFSARPMTSQEKKMLRRHSK